MSKIVNEPKWEGGKTETMWVSIAAVFCKKTKMQKKISRAQRRIVRRSNTQFSL